MSELGERGVKGMESSLSKRYGATTAHAYNGPKPKRRMVNFLTFISILSAVVALSVLLIPVFDLALDYLDYSPPYWAEARLWLLDSSHGLMVFAISFLLFVFFGLLFRSSIRRNKSLSIVAGCPQCYQHDLYQIPPKGRDLVLDFWGLGMKRYACRDCAWRGRRVASEALPVVTVAARVPSTPAAPASTATPPPQTTDLRTPEARETSQKTDSEAAISSAVGSVPPQRAVQQPVYQTPPPALAVPGAQNSSKQFSFVRAILRGWWFVILLGLVTAITLHSINSLADPLYESEVTLQINAPPPQEDPLFSQFGRPSYADEVQQARSNLADFIRESSSVYQALERLPDINMGRQELRETVRVELPPSSQLLHVQVRTPNPELSAFIANALVDISVSQYAELQARPTAGTRQFVTEELAAAEERLQSIELELDEFRERTGYDDIEQQINLQNELIRALLQRRDEALILQDQTTADKTAEMIELRETELKGLRALLPSYQRITDQLNQARNEKNLLQEKLGESQIKENQILAKRSIQVIADARPPVRPLSGFNLRLVLLGALAGVMAGVFLVVIWALMRNRRDLVSLENLGNWSDIIEPADQA